MTARTVSPYRAKSLGYLRDGRVTVHECTHDPYDSPRPTLIDARIEAAPGDRSGNSVRVRVWLDAGSLWNCDEHPGHNSCAHRLAVQMVTGWGRLEGHPYAAAVQVGAVHDEVRAPVQPVRTPVHAGSAAVHAPDAGQWS